MSFQEKSAWIMTLGLFVTAVFYFYTVFAMSLDGQLAPPNVPILVIYTVMLTVIAIVGHIVVAALSAKEANAKLDERERRIFDKAGYLSGTVFGFGIVLSLMFYLFSHSGDLLFYTVFASLIIGQLLEYILQIYFYRRLIA